MTEAGELLRAVTYVAGDDFEREERRPRAEYLDKILVGARHHKLPEDYVAFVEGLGRGLNV